MVEPIDHSAVAISTSSAPFQGLPRLINSVLYNPLIDSANALMLLCLSTGRDGGPGSGVEQVVDLADDAHSAPVTRRRSGSPCSGAHVFVGDRFALGPDDTHRCLLPPCGHLMVGGSKVGESVPPDRGGRVGQFEGCVLSVRGSVQSRAISCQWEPLSSGLRLRLVPIPGAYFHSEPGWIVPRNNAPIRRAGNTA